MYVGVMSVLVGEALLWRSAALGFYALFMLAAFHLRVMVSEEPTLRRLYGDSYDEYLRRVPRWVPRIRRPGG
jgi:protein-S-isoprenylcysteine O-methyltransferase Ste14